MDYSFWPTIRRSIPDLGLDKKTQRNKDWPVIELLANIYYEENKAEPTGEWIQFWLRQMRTPANIQRLVRRFSGDGRACWAAGPCCNWQRKNRRRLDVR